jgi:SAM-dependent methyltransferase
MNGFPRSLLSDLRCPCCGSGLQISLDCGSGERGLTNALLRCDCYEYPVVNGVAVLRQISPVSSTQNGAVECLRRGDVPGAHEWLLLNASAPGVPRPSQRSARVEPSGWRRLLKRDSAPVQTDVNATEEDFESTLRAHRPSGYADYLLQRFANPSFLGAMLPLAIVAKNRAAGPRRRLLDVLCGVGHSSGFVRNLYPDVEVIMADVDYVNLYLGSRFLAPGAVTICMDVELPLPFSDGALDAAFCLDGLHYVRSKCAFLKEIDRTVSAAGAWAFAHMHNASRQNINPGAPLDAAGYMSRFRFGQLRLLPEGSVIEQFRTEGSLDLTNQASMTVLDASPTLTLIGARDDHLWKQHSDLDAIIAARPQLLTINPLYRAEHAADRILLRAVWPSAALKQECEASAPLFPERLEIDKHMFEAIAAARPGEQLSSEVRALLRSFIVVPLHECYARPVL